ncbi:uncharacterized protein LOC115332017, partial [Ixodes scapularis]|uniref:uncharacterized protein LOC115332017 n=1 Tax=Ixodes scapularis TaxID=6945 RepID=UPI001AA00103
IVKHHTTLGVIFSEHLSWDRHIDNLVRRLCRVIGVIRRCRTILPVNIKLTMFDALFRSHINYSNLVWGKTTTSNLNKILLLQEKILRIIADVHYLYHTKPLFQKIKIIGTNMHLYRLLYAVLCGTNEFNEFFLRTSDLNKKEISISMRCSHIWYVPHFRTNHALQSLRHMLPTLLNRYHLGNIDIYSLTTAESYVCFIYHGCLFMTFFFFSLLHNILAAERSFALTSLLCLFLLKYMRSW